jgi:hypothetical protein
LVSQINIRPDEGVETRTRSGSKSAPVLAVLVAPSGLRTFFSG